VKKGQSWHCQVEMRIRMHSQIKSMQLSNGLGCKGMKMVLKITQEFCLECVLIKRAEERTQISETLF
jgi:hypothetical protein